MPGHRFRSALIALMVLVPGSLVGAQQYNVLHTFTYPDGAEPYGAMTLSGSTLYGITVQEAAGYGSIYKVNTDGSGFVRLHAFDGTPAGGSLALGSLLVSGSTLYGLASEDGNANGIAFKLNTDGSGFTTLHSFTPGTEGYDPQGSFVLTGSTLYGMTLQGGSAGGTPMNGPGTIFKMNTDGGGFTVLHTFTRTLASDGGYPRGTLLLSGSTFYGATDFSGTFDHGTLFKMNMDGSDFTLLHSFGGPGEGSAAGSFGPGVSLTQVGSKLFGITAHGGSAGNGTIFSVGLDGTGFTILHSFGADATDGFQPFGSLLYLNGLLYGTTSEGGGQQSASGVVFSIAPDGSGYTVVHPFSTYEGGFQPFDSLTGAGNTVYGPNSSGGINNQGTIFSLTVPEPSASALGAAGFTLVLVRNRRRASKSR